MHNGQIGGFEKFRRDAEMMIPEELYSDRKGATDSEALFLVALGEGLDADPRGALERAAARFISIAKAKGAAPYLRMTAALSDGKKLYAVRYSSDEQVPSLYYRYSETRQGMAVVSEPLEDGQGDWTEIASASFSTFDGETVTVEDFRPCRLALAA